MERPLAHCMEQPLAHCMEQPLAFRLRKWVGVPLPPGDNGLKMTVIFGTDAPAGSTAEPDTFTCAAAGIAHSRRIAAAESNLKTQKPAIHRCVAQSR